MKVGIAGKMAGTGEGATEQAYQRSNDQEHACADA